MRGKLFVLLVLLGIAAPLLGQEPQSPQAKLRSSVEPTELTIGDRVQYKINVEFQEGLTPLPIALSSGAAAIETLGIQSDKPTSNANGTLTQNHVLYLTTFATGTVVVPPISIPFKTPDNDLAMAETQPVDLTVQSVLEEQGDKGGLAPLKGFFNFKSYFWVWILVGVLLLALAVYFLYRLRQERQKAQGLDAQPRRPPDEVFWEKIQACEDQGLVAPEEARAFYSALSFAVREYLETRFGVDALDRTTPEILSGLKKVALEAPLPSYLKRFFETGDLVKFAKLAPPLEEMEGDLDRIKEFASRTAPRQKQDAPKEELPV